MARLGVGKSGGCRNCRRRKVRCDERKPKCQRCERANKECEGYVQDHRFVNENARIEKHVKKQISRTPKAITKSSQDVILVVNSEHSSVVIPSSMRLCAFEDNIFISFLLSNLFLGMPVSTPWLHLHAEDASSVSAQLSVRALSTTFFGKTHHRRDITARGYELYGQALISLNRDLQDSKKAWSMSVLKSAMALELFEFVTFSSASGWIKHAAGMGRLFEVRGPLKHQSGEERDILEASRAIVALGHLVNRKRCFLESQEWKTVPWALERGSKPIVAYLHDILCDLPGLMEDADLLKSSAMRSEDFEAHQFLVSDRISSCLKQLYEWRVTWQQQNPNSCWEIQSNDTTTDPVLFPIVFQYPSLVEANSITLYNAILLLLMKLGFQVFGPSFNSTALSHHLPQDLDYSPLIPPGMAPNPQALAIEICKGVEYHLCKERRRAGAFFLMFPLRVAWQAFHSKDPVAVWLEGTMKMIADSTGFEVSRGLAGSEGFQPADRDERVLPHEVRT